MGTRKQKLDRATTERCTKWMSEWVTGWVSDWLIERVTDWVSECRVEIEIEMKCSRTRQAVLDVWLVYLHSWVAGHSVCLVKRFCTNYEKMSVPQLASPASATNCHPLSLIVASFCCSIIQNWQLNELSGLSRISLLLLLSSQPWKQAPALSSRFPI